MQKTQNKSALRLAPHFRVPRHTGRRWQDGRMDKQEREDQLTTAPKAVPSDADPRVDVSSTTDGNTRIDWRDDAKIKPGKA